MVRRSVRLAALALATLASVPPDVLADQQDARRIRWTLSPERSARGDDRLEALRVLSPAGVLGSEINWVKSSDLKPGSRLQLDLAQGWTLCADWERYRPRAVQVRDAIDTFLLGVQYTFH